MDKQFHEVRDPIHAFIRLTTDERKVLNSRPLQRLRYIHQLALTYLVYPGATHRRFEHSLGVMELATRIFDVVTNQANLTDEIRGLLPEAMDDYQRAYSRQHLRIAALCHDVGHLPFSHAAEKGELLPEGWGTSN
jgi:HD superfamily phosphohydrolase